jgi:hypothetical protein
MDWYYRIGDRMACRTLFAVSAWLLACSTTLAAPMDCPTSDWADIDDLVAAAPSCDASMELLLACQRGSSGDVPPALSVIKKCENDFLASLSKSAHRAYDRKVDACWRQFAKESGTLYRSMRAICAAGLAHTYADRAAKSRKR